jgi:hypothetical protein
MDCGKYSPELYEESDSLMVEQEVEEIDEESIF